MSTGPSFSVGDEGGSETHEHDFTSSTHAHSLGGGVSVTSIGTPKSVGIVAWNAVETGTTDSETALPKYYAMAYIQYLGI